MKKASAMFQQCYKAINRKDLFLLKAQTKIKFAFTIFAVYNVYFLTNLQPCNIALLQCFHVKVKQYVMLV